MKIYIKDYIFHFMYFYTLAIDFLFIFLFRMTELTEIWKQSNPQLNQAFQRAGNGMDLSHLMNDLKDPEFQKRLTSMKTRQQEYIMTLLRRRGQLIELPDGGSIIITGPNLTSFTIPLSLKKKPVEYWTENEKIWLNM